MVRCGLDQNFNGVWEKQQIYPHLQGIVSKYRENFDGKIVSDSMGLDG